jgi:predicted outer membrane protein
MLVLAIFVIAGSVAIFMTVPSGASPDLTRSSQFVQTTTSTQFGPINASDIDFLVKVRQAGLWEIPTGQQAGQRASSERVKEVGAHLVKDHTALDKEVLALAGKLDVLLPSQASADQQRWMAELSGKFGQEYDLAFAKLLRAAHGKVFAVVAQVRAGTRNDEIRSFAQRAVNVVMRHMTLLESTGLVDYTALPPAPPPPPSTPSTQGVRP